MKNMIRLFLFSFLFIYTISTVSAQTVNATTSLSTSLMNSSSSNGKKLRNIGIGLACFGVADIIGGAAMVISADGVVYYRSQTNSYGTTEEGSLTGAMGALGIIGGTVAVLGGTAMIIVGQHKLNKSKKVSLNLTPFSGNIVYRF